MMENDLISRSALKEALKRQAKIYKNEIDIRCNAYFGLGVAATELREAPAIDAVPVVRCKDCRYSEPMKKHGVCKFGENALNCTQCRGDDGYGYAGISVIHPDDYCSDGAPKEESV